MLRSFLAEPRVANPPGVGWRDAVLVAAVLVGLALEAALRDTIVWKPIALVAFALLAGTLLIRRREPLLAVGLVLATIFVFDVAAVSSGRDPVQVNSGVFVLVLVYALFRWGSGSHALIGAAMMAVITVMVQVTNYTGLGDLIGGTLVFFFPAAIGLAVRYQGSIREQRIDTAKSREREELARELHDTVAHHVSAIAIQAQAGQVLAASSPEAAVKALQVIEGEASRTLAEMRAIVQALRGDDQDLAMAPQRGVADIHELALAAGDNGPRIDVIVEGLDELAPSLDAGLYRLAQESITNAVRHAHNASLIEVRITGSADQIRLAVTDDGAVASKPREGGGWGLIGMNERAELLGGSLRAGPHPPHGWQVEAILPRTRVRALRGR